MSVDFINIVIFTLMYINVCSLDSYKPLNVFIKILFYISIVCKNGFLNYQKSQTNKLEI